MKAGLSGGYIYVWIERGNVTSGGFPGRTLRFLIKENEIVTLTAGLGEVV